MMIEQPHRFRAFFFAALAGAGVFVFALLTFVGVTLSYESRVYPNVSIAGLRFEHGPQTDVTRLLSLRSDRYLHTPYDLSFNGQHVQATPHNLGIHHDLQSTMAPVISLGSVDHWREAGTWKRKMRAIIRGEDFPIIATVDEDVLEEYLFSVFVFDLPEPVDAKISYDEQHDRFTISESVNGVGVDLETLRSELISRAVTFSGEPVVIQTTSLSPRVTQADLELALQRALPTLEIPRTMTSGDHSWDISPTQLKQWISFDPQLREDGTTVVASAFNEHLLEEYLREISKDLGELPRNARLGVDDAGNIVVIEESVTGRALSTDENVAALARFLLTNERTIALVPDDVLPEVRSETLAELGIVGLVGSGSSNFKGSPSDRVHNIRVGSSKFDGVLLEPGEVFSFNTILGSTEAKDGFVNALVIQGKDIVPSMGGGLCQVSTTAFRAAVFSGLEIVERSPHSFHVSYYGDPGFDATVWIGGKDFRFRNDTSGHLYIQTDVSGMSMSFTFFGTPDHREIVVNDPVITQRNENGSMHTLLTRQITYADGRTHEDEFTSFYKPRSAFMTEEEKKKKEEEERLKQEEEQKRLAEEQNQQQVAGEEATPPQPES